MVQPGEESALDHEVERDPARHEAHDVLHDGEEREHNPIREPLRVVGGVSRVDGLERHVGGVGEGKNVGHQLHPAHAVDHGAEEGDEGEKEVHLRLTCLLLQVAETVCGGEGRFWGGVVSQIEIIVKC